MAEVKIQFDSDEPVTVTDIQDNQPFNLSVQKTDIEIGNGVSVVQPSNVITFRDGSKTFKIWVE